MNLTELSQYTNEIGGRLGEIGDKTGKGLSEISGQIFNLRNVLENTNTLLIILIVLFAINIVISFFKKK
ncbi:hypothetical protein [Paenibacillus pseudetheri]|uniref:Uncharacterized protein n=1 Tax=Paenibacillus pseudetheri TaxID=2897682 RepID=A0ABM9BJC9_9BACL|nr:hypothetical protein [Paenibacillus pseudetheri]CAH1058836.1 hypothetical protein PAECIP111894_05022 [Paenibacillus pseudetheri]